MWLLWHDAWYGHLRIWETNTAGVVLHSAHETMDHSNQLHPAHKSVWVSGSLNQWRMTIHFSSSCALSFGHQGTYSEPFLTPRQNRLFAWHDRQSAHSASVMPTQRLRSYHWPPRMPFSDPNTMHLRARHFKAPVILPQSDYGAHYPQPSARLHITITLVPLHANRAFAKTRFRVSTHPEE